MDMFKDCTSLISPMLKYPQIWQKVQKLFQLSAAYQNSLLTLIGPIVFCCNNNKVDVVNLLL
jgi:hypothetical protein